MTLKANHHVVGFRPSRILRLEFIRKCKRLKKIDSYSTQDRVLIELISMWVSDKVKIPGEK